jgi:hypothetical protein
MTDPIGLYSSCIHPVMSYNGSLVFIVYEISTRSLFRSANRPLPTRKVLQSKPALLENSVSQPV